MNSKARFQLDTMVQVIDMITGKSSDLDSKFANKLGGLGQQQQQEQKNENEAAIDLTCKLVQSLKYDAISETQYRVIGRSKSEQCFKTFDIFENGIESLKKSIVKSRNYSNDLLQLSKCWRLRTLDTLIKHNSILTNVPQTTGMTLKTVIADYRLQKRPNSNLNSLVQNSLGLLPLFYSIKTGNVEMPLTIAQNQSKMVKFIQTNNKNNNSNNNNNNNDTTTNMKSIGSTTVNTSNTEKNVTIKTEKKEGGIVGFGDDDDDEDEDEEEEDIDINMNNMMNKFENINIDDGSNDDSGDNDEFGTQLEGWKEISEYLFFSQIELVYSELYRQLRLEISTWQSMKHNGIRCQTTKHGIITIYTPGLSDFIIKFETAKYAKIDSQNDEKKLSNNDDDDNDNDNNDDEPKINEMSRFDKFCIECYDEPLISKKLSQKIETFCVLKLIKTWTYDQQGFNYKSISLGALQLSF